MRTRVKIVYVVTAIVVSLVFADCNPAKKTPASAKEEPLKEIAPGLLQGYLSREEIPNSILLVPPPPEEGIRCVRAGPDYAVVWNQMARFNQASLTQNYIFRRRKIFEPTLVLRSAKQNTKVVRDAKGIDRCFQFMLQK
jgi:hypothetical protein